MELTDLVSSRLQGVLTRAVSSFGFPKNPVDMEDAFLDPVKRGAFYIMRLPALAFFGVSVTRLDQDVCHVELPFSYRTQNPFHSVYFAAQAAGAELATGALVLRAIAGRGDVSMLVVSMEAEFSKKAKGTIQFVCSDGAAIHQAAEKASAGEAMEVVATSIGRLHDGTEVSRFRIRWAMKKKGQ